MDAQGEFAARVIDSGLRGLAADVAAQVEAEAAAGGSGASGPGFKELADETAVRLRYLAEALAAGATEVVPLADTYWGDRFGKLVDPFGHYWSIASRVEKVSPEELVERTRAATWPTEVIASDDTLAA